MTLVARRPENGETLFAIKYYDCDLGEEFTSSAFVFEDKELAEEYGRSHFAYEKTGNTEFVGVVRFS